VSHGGNGKAKSGGTTLNNGSETATRSASTSIYVNDEGKKYM
jgi:hypothetical protein